MPNMSPRFVRPSWLEVSADGRQIPMSIGPKVARGTMQGILTVRHKGRVFPAMRFEAVPSGDDIVLHITINDSDGDSQRIVQFYPMEEKK